MFDTISITDLRRHFTAVLDAVEKKRAMYVVTRRKQAVAVLILYSTYVKLQKLNGKYMGFEFGDLLGKMAGLHASVSDDEIEADLVQAAQEPSGKRRPHRIARKESGEGRQRR